MNRPILTALAVSILAIGCGTNHLTTNPKVPAAVIAHDAMTAREVITQGTLVDTNGDQELYSLPDGSHAVVSKVAYHIIYWYDYPCDFIGPPPPGHDFDLDCNDPSAWTAPKVIVP